jgi:translation initiation factor IF-1
VIEEVLPNQMYRVRLDDGRTLQAGLSAGIRHSVVRLISGSVVLVKVSRHDPNRGQIVQKA